MGQLDVAYSDPAPAAQAADEWVNRNAAVLADMKWSMERPAPQVITVRRRMTPFAAVLLGVFTFPIGILFWLFWKREEVFTVRWQDAAEGSSVYVQGNGSGPVADGFRVKAA